MTFQKLDCIIKTMELEIQRYVEDGYLRWSVYDKNSDFKTRKFLSRESAVTFIEGYNKALEEIKNDRR